MKILTICPTKNRPELFRQMYQSWGDNITYNNTMIAGIDIGDETISAYPSNVNKVICKAGSTVTEVINSIWSENQDYDFYHIINDDVLFNTRGFDSKLATILEEKGGGVAYGNDLFQGKSLPTFPFISANIVKSVGYLQLPILNRYCGDTVWADIGHICNCLYYLGEVIIEHRHKLAGKGDTDVDMPIFQEDWHSYTKWGREQRMFDVRKVMEVLNG